MIVRDAAARLSTVLNRHPALAIAVSGGVDSIVPAHIAHQSAGISAIAVHAVSPAVPEEATERVRAHAERFGWTLRLLDARELSDPGLYCKPGQSLLFLQDQSLHPYSHGDGCLPIASGTNTDDLSDFRPGLKAAQHHGVVHPFVEASISKDEIYALARRHRLTDLAGLPAQPCLASRIETGITVDAAALGFIERAERELRKLLPSQAALRCRITARGIVVESSPLPEDALRARTERLAASICASNDRSFAGLRAYQRGSAFLLPQGTS